MQNSMVFYSYGAAARWLSARREDLGKPLPLSHVYMAGTVNAHIASSSPACSARLSAYEPGTCITAHKGSGQSSECIGAWLGGPVS